MAIAFSLSGYVSPCAAAEDMSWLIGEWTGTANGAPGDPVRRIIISSVRPDGQIVAGYGTSTTARPDNAIATLNGSNIAIKGKTSENGAQVTRSGDTLVGKIINAGSGKPIMYDITFTKTASAASPAPDAAKGKGKKAPEVNEANVKMIYDESMKNTGTLRTACQGGRKGVIDLVTKSVGQLMASGKLTGNPQNDANQAGERVGQKCADYGR